MKTLDPKIDVHGRAIRLTHLEKRLWPPSHGRGWTKGDCLGYLLATAEVLLPYYAARPLVVTRYPDGVDKPGFYQKNKPAGTPEWVDTFRFHSPSGRSATTFIVLNKPETLVWLGNTAAIELHPWLSTVERPEKPDRMVIDLDPATGATFGDVVRVARVVKALLDRLGWPGFLKTSGATGLHVLVPIRPRWDFHRVARLARYIGLAVQRLLPDKVTLERPVEKRRGKVYFDYLQNGLGKTVVGPYSARPLPGGPVSCPVDWDELGSFEPSDFTMATVPGRLAARGDLWRGLLDDRLQVDLTPWMRKFGLD